MTDFKRFIAIFLAALMLLSFVACKKTEEEGSETEDTAVESDVAPDSTEGDETVVFTPSDIEKFKIVYASDLAQGAMAEVQKLAERIKNTYGVAITVTSDFIMSNNDQLKEWDNEILVGKTNREESIAFAEELRLDDYGYGYKDGKILIGGGCDEAVKNAVVMFTLDVIVGNTNKDVFYSSEWTKIEKKSYTVDELKINGVDIKDYKIVYPVKANLFEKKMAESLQDNILRTMGYTVPVVTDAAASTAQAALIIGRTKLSERMSLATLSASEGCVLGNGTLIVAYGEDVQGVVNATKLLKELLFDSSSKDKVRSVSITDPKKYDDGGEFSVMTHNLQVGDVPADRIARTMKLIYRYMPDTIGVQEAKPTWMNAIREHLGDYYGIVGEGRDGGSKGEHCAILYAKAKYNLIESGTKWLTDTPDEVSKLPGSTYIRIVTWALLEDKDSGVRYLHVNTHLEGGEYTLLQAKYIMQLIKSYNDVAVVMTGDMNATINTEAMQYLMNNGFASKYDFKALDSMPLFGRGSVIDWIFVTDDSMTLTNYVTDDNLIDGDHASDHNTYFAEFTVKYPTEGKLDHGWTDLDFSKYPDAWLDVEEDTEGSEYGDFIYIRR